MTALSPMENVLFRAWAAAHGINNHDDPNNKFDFKGVFQRTNGMIHPPGHINQMADEHNATQDAQGGGKAIDPAMAAVEHAKNQAEAQASARADALKVHLLERAHAQKLQLQQMQLDHKSQESAKVRAHEMMQDHMAQQQQAQQAQHGQIHDALQTHMTRRNALQDAVLQRYQALHDQAVSRQHNFHGKLLAEYLTRTRPKPTPTASV